MTDALRTPERRTCTRCGRTERWDEDHTNWKVTTEAGQRRVGDPFCIHEWDIDGSFRPFEG
jgi:hypothetical protein